MTSSMPLIGKIGSQYAKMSASMSASQKSGIE